MAFAEMFDVLPPISDRGARKSLAELHYEWPQGFARFSLSAMNAGVGELSDEKKREFEQVLGCELMAIYRHL